MRREPGRAGDAAEPVTLYWRPGCVWCHRLQLALWRRGLDHERRNIWRDEDARDLVRAVNDGDETVPTVTVGDTVMVNPPARRVVAAAARHGQRPDRPAADDGPVGRVVARLLGA